MATLDDLSHESIAEVSPDEAIEMLRQIRLSRRVPVKKHKPSTVAKKAKEKAVPKVSAEQAVELLKILEGGGP